MEWVAGLIGVVVGAGVTVGVACLERRWRRQEARAAEKRARLEERLEPVRRYGLALDGFVRGAARYMRIWAHLGAPKAAAGDLRQLVEGHWANVAQVTPRPEPVSIVEDTAARDPLLNLQLVVWRCRDRCLEVLEAGHSMADDEADRYVAEAHEHLELMLMRMDELVEEVDG